MGDSNRFASILTDQWGREFSETLHVPTELDEYLTSTSSNWILLMFQWRKYSHNRNEYVVRNFESLVK